MKNIMKLMIPCLAVAFALTSCDSTMDDKASIDAKYEKPSSATVSLSSAAAADFQTITASAAVSGEDVVESGIQVCSDASFLSGVKTVVSEAATGSFTASVSGLAEQTSYYVRAYAATKTAGILVTEAQSVTTPKAPIYPVEGVYVATEVDYDEDSGEWAAADQYEMLIERDANDPTIVNITNIWGGGMTVQGQYDEAKGTITVPNMQVIYVHKTYGDVWIRGVNSTVSAYTSSVTFNFTALGGKMTSTPMGALCSAGPFGYFYLTMEHQ